jgi:hypothetical protein
LIYDNGTNIGIGTTTPNSKLDIHGNVNFNYDTLFTGGSNDSSNYITSYIDLNNGDEFYKIAGYNGGQLITTEPEVDVLTWQWNGRVGIMVPKYFVQNTLDVNGSMAVGSYAGNHASPDPNGLIVSGNVGIGTYNPLARFHVESDTPNTGVMQINNANPAGFSGAFFYEGATMGGYIGRVNETSSLGGPGLMQLASTKRALVFSTSTGPGFNERMRIDSLGNVGIGTTSPVALLDVEGNVMLSKTSDNTNGNVGIGGIIGGDTKLEVTSNQPYGEYIYDTVSTSFALFVNGIAAKPGSASWVISSDERLKSNIQKYDDGLAQLLKINPVKFHYNAESGYNTEKEWVGVIAQDLQKVAPYMVGKFNRRSDKKEFLDVDNSAMTYMLINSVKELSKKNDAKDAEINALKSELEQIKARLNKIEQNTPKQIR